MQTTWSPTVAASDQTAANRPAKPIPHLTDGTLLGVLLLLAALSTAALTWLGTTSGSHRLAWITLDRLTSALTLLVAVVGAVTFRFSQRYLKGEPRQTYFLRWLFTTVCAAYVLMLSSHLLLLFGAWLLVSVGLHQLLTFYPERGEGRRAARKKFLISRLGDVALAAAVGVVWQSWGTLDLNSTVQAAAAAPGSPAAVAVALLITIAALTKSAQFPFHSWLPETMEAPTPVSALMHAGIVNAGGALLLRFAPLLAQVPEALLLLSAVGTLTFTLGMLAMWAQVKVKRVLAWSTVSQMGFMMVQCGLGAFPAAALHIVGHGCYKAWSFLRSGELPPSAPGAKTPPPARVLLLLAGGTALGILAIALGARLTGFSPLRTPGELALTAIACLSLGQIWAVLLGSAARAVTARVVTAFFLTFAAAVGLAALYRGAESFLEPVWGPLAPPAGPLAWAAALLPVAACTALVALHPFLPHLCRSAAGRAFYVHALHGFYFGALADRVVDRLWSHPSARGTSK